MKIDTTNLWGLVDCTKEKNYACQTAAEEVTTTVGPTTTSASSTSGPTGSSVGGTETSGPTESSTTGRTSSTGDSSATTVDSPSSVSSQSATESASSNLVCEDGWTLSDSMCFKIIETAVAFANAETECAGLAEGATMAAPKSAAIMTSLNALNPSGEDVWVGLDDRYGDLFLWGSLDLYQTLISGMWKELTHSQMELHLSKLEALWEATTSPGVTVSPPGSPVSRMPMPQRRRQRTA